MIHRLFSYALIIAGFLGAPALAQDVAAGQAAFKAQCSMCHAVVAGRNGMGPSLSGVTKRKPASAAGFAYSPAMKASKVKWDAATLNKFVASPATVVPGSRMIFAGVKDATRRAAIVAYLKTL